MARPSTDENQRPTAPLFIAGRSDIAKVIYEDGSSITFPSVASPNTNSSTTHSPSTFRSRSSSAQTRGRRHAGSFSSTGSVRETFNSLSVVNSPEEHLEDTHSLFRTNQKINNNFESRNHTSQFDTIDTVEEWDSSCTFPLGTTDEWDALDMPSQSQDELVANAEGAGQWMYAEEEQGVDNTIYHIDIDNMSGEGNHGRAPEFYNYAGSNLTPRFMDWHAADRSDPTDRYRTDAAILTSDVEQSLVTGTNQHGKPARRPGRMPGTKLPEEKRRKVAIMRVIGWWSLSDA